MADQDPSRSIVFHKDRVESRSYDVLVGLCKGILADSNVNKPEAEFLHNWLCANPELACEFPCSILADRLAAHLADGVLDEEEAQDLLFLLQEMTGEKGQQGKGDAPTQLAYDNPMPELIFSGHIFCLTGTFQSGVRKNIAAHLEKLGAVIKSDVPKSIPCCLVIGSLVTPAWMFSTHGRKIEKAVSFRDAGMAIAVISEDHLFNELMRLGLNA